MDAYLSECPHERDWFDRSFCPEPCGSMHTRCAACGIALGSGCVFDRRSSGSEEES